MSVKIRGTKFHYRFNYEGKCYSGVCEGCRTEKQALAYEQRMRATVENVRAQKTVKALVENYRYELTGGKPISIAEAFELSLQKPVKRVPSEKHIQQKRAYWSDFSAFLAIQAPEVVDLADIRKSHCEAYVKYLQDHGRYIKEVKLNARCGRRRRKVVERTYSREYLLSPKTIIAIAGACAEVIRKLAEDAGIVVNPWDGVVLPENDPENREIFTEAELALIKKAAPSDSFCFPLFVVAAATGLTEGDICTLKWDEIDFACGLIRHRRRKTGVWMEIPMVDGLRNYFESLPRSEDYLFPKHAGMYLSNPSGVSYRVITFLQGLGIQTTRKIEGRRDVSVKDLHSMRHVFCYYAGTAGIPLAVVQSIVGHMTADMTRHYQAHVTRAAKQQAAEMLPAMLCLAGSSNALLPSSSGSNEASLRRELIRLAEKLPIDEVRRIVAQHTSARIA